MSHVTITTRMAGYLVPSPRYSFRFEAVSRLWDLNLTLSVYLGNATFAKILPFVPLFLWMIVAVQIFPRVKQFPDILL